MKKLLILIFVLIAAGCFAQPSVTILPANQTICPGGNATFDVVINPDTSTGYIFQWKKNGNFFFTEDSVHPHLVLKNLTYADTGYYTVTVVTTSGNYESSRGYVHFMPALTIDTLYRYNALGCPGTCKGQMKVQVSGGNPPYDYYWGAGFAQDTIVTSLCKGTYQLTVYDSDSSHCVSKEYKVEVLTLPKVTFTKTPDKVFLTNPTLTVAFPDSSRPRISNWEWIFYGLRNSQGKRDSVAVPNVNPAKHVYSAPGTYLIHLHYTDLNGCDSTASDSIVVRIADLEIADVFTPGTPPNNETFVIRVNNTSNDTTSTAPGVTQTINDVYLSNELVVLDRWGRQVYKKTNYIVDKDNKGEWDGGNLAEGVYYYIFTGHGYYGDEVWKGSVTIIGRKYKQP